MVGPIDADDVDVVLAVAQPHDTVDGASRVGSDRCRLGLVSQRAGDQRARAWTPVRWDLTDWRRRTRVTALERHDLAGGRRSGGGARTRARERVSADRQRERGDPGGE